MEIFDYYTTQQVNRFYTGIEKYNTPCLLFNLDIVKRNYEQMLKYYREQ